MYSNCQRRNRWMVLMASSSAWRLASAFAWEREAMRAWCAVSAWVGRVVIVGRRLEILKEFVYCDLDCML